MFRFTIRDLVLLTIIVAMGVGWWLDRRGLLARCRQIEKRAEYAEGAAEFHETMEEHERFFRNRFEMEWARVLDEVDDEAKAAIDAVYRRIEAEKASRPKQGLLPLGVSGLP